LLTVNQMITIVISKEDKILIESLYETKSYSTRKLLKQFPQKKLNEKWFRELDYVLMLFLIVTVNEISK